MNTAAEVVLLPENCTKIGARAFANCRSLWMIAITAMQIDIADDAFAGTADIIILAQEGSAAIDYATAHDIPYVVFEDE